MRLSADEGPQTIGTKKAFIVVPEKMWRAVSEPRQPLGQWLVKNMPRGANLELPNRDEPERSVPFSDENRA